MFDSKEKKQRAAEELKEIIECGEQAGISHAMFVGFGLLLGIVREQDFIGWDSDMDMCIDADRITPEQELKYYKALKQRKLFFAREKRSFKDSEDGFQISSVVPGTMTKKVRFTWFSLRKKAGYPKCCNWFFFKWNGYYWHSKGHKWVTPQKFDMKKFGYDTGDAALMKGIPAECLESFDTIKFYGIKLQIPSRYGSCLDFWYPGWWMPKKGGASSKKVIAVVNNWRDQRDWRVQVV